MQVKVSKYLNARIGKASTSAACVDFKSPGDTIDVMAVLVGDEITGNAIWYQNKADGCYYWSEGVADQAFLLESGDVFPGLSNSDKYTFLRSYVYAFLASAAPSSNVICIGVTNIGNTVGINFGVSKAFNKAELDLVNDQLIFRGAKIPYQLSPATSYKPNIYKDTDTPFVLGGTIANKATKETGSRGIVVKRDNQTLLLTCFHVACKNLMNEGLTEFDGSSIELLTPSPMATGSTVGPVSTFVSEGELNRYFDYAATPVSADEFGNFLDGHGIINTAFTRADFNQLAIGMPLQTFGAFTGYTTGNIKQINYGKTDITYDGVGTISMIETIVTDKLSVEGDSGAPVYNDENKLVGLIIGNNDQTSSSLIMPIHQLFFNKNLSL